MIGQKRLQKRLKCLSINNLPHTLMLLGEKGCGKHMFVEMISNKLGIGCIDITHSINLDMINEIQSNPIETMYYIDCNKITEKNQNTVLKLLEEPINTAFIILMCENKYNLLETIVNRCIVWEFEPYSLEELEQFGKCTYKDIFNTPGQIMESANYNIDDMVALCRMIFSKINKACCANVLIIPDKMAYKNECNKYDIDIFLKVLNYICAKEFSNYYDLTSKLLSDSLIQNIDKRKLLENFLFKLKLRVG